MNSQEGVQNRDLPPPFLIPMLPFSIFPYLGSNFDNLFIVIHKQVKFKESKGQIDLWIKPNQIYVYLVSGPVYHVYPTRYDTFLVFWLWCIEVVLQAAARGWLGWWRHTKVGAGPVPLSCLTSRSQDRDQALWRRNLEMMGKVARCPGSSTSVRWHHHHHHLYTTVTSLIP